MLFSPDVRQHLRERVRHYPAPLLGNCKVGPNFFFSPCPPQPSWRTAGCDSRVGHECLMMQKDPFMVGDYSWDSAKGAQISWDPFYAHYYVLFCYVMSISFSKAKIVYQFLSKNYSFQNQQLQLGKVQVILGWGGQSGKSKSNLQFT